MARLWKIEKVSRKFPNNDVKEPGNGISALIRVPVVVAMNDTLSVDQHSSWKSRCVKNVPLQVLAITRSIIKPRFVAHSQQSPRPRTDLAQP